MPKKQGFMAGYGAVIFRPQKLRLTLHDQIEIWVNEGGAGDEADALADSDLSTMQRKGQPLRIDHQK